MLTPEESAELTRLEAAFEEAGGRGVELAERIDALREKRDEITIKLEIENRYELYETQMTYPEATIPAPPTLDETAWEYREWADEHIFDLTGVGHEDGDSWYDVKVLDSSEPALIGRTFEFGY